MPYARTIVVAAVLAAATSLAPLAVAAPENVRVVEAWPGMTFQNPIGLVGDPTRADRMYVLEQGGRVLVVTEDPAGPAKAEVFLDLTGQVVAEGQGGVLGLAFHPRFVENGRCFVCYLGRTGADPKFKVVLSAFPVAGGKADKAGELVLLEIPKSMAHHNGGGLLFGPDDMLYMSTGDNRVQKEAVDTAQNPASLLGKILRIDVDQASPGLPYAIPADNPWAQAGPGVRGEIWAYGFRNPYRFCFDAAGTMWTCEPGTKDECRESVVQVQRGGNHGWPFFEGSRPMEPIPASLRGATFVPPVFEYVRTGGQGTTAAVGGYVYRGSAIPSLKGLYVFGDYGRNVVLALDLAAQPPALHVLGAVDTFSGLGENRNGELFASSHEQGKVYRLR